MQLAVGSNTYKITLASGQNNLNGLVSAINNLGAGVTASVLTTGGTSGDYLSVTANSTGATTLTLIDDPTGTTPTDVLTDSNQGSNTNFDLNGVAVSSSSATVNNVIPGLVLNFAGTTSASETVNVNVAVDSSQISSALQTLVSNYNTLTADENTEMGTGGGSLVGNNIVYQIRQAMSDIVDYEGDNSQGVGNLSALGIEINESGQMTFNQQTFDALTTSQISSGLQLLGNSTTGIGGLQQVFNQITDPADGTIAEQQSQWQTTATNLTTEISTKVAQIQANEQTLDQQLQAADASVADLATQQSTLTAEITSLDYTSYGYNTDISSTQST
jgi:flagellar hook-associated protein 2